MFLGDLHTHSRCSPDGSRAMADMALAAGAAGLTLLCVTDHCDLLDLDGAPTPRYDWDPCRADFQAAAERLPAGLSLRRGVELGEAYEDPAAARAILAAAPELDLVIGSVHNLRTIQGKRDFYYADYADPAFCQAALEDYLGSLEALTGLPDCYDTLAHLLYPLRYMERAGRRVSLLQGELAPRLEGVLRQVADQGKALEVNTWRGRTVAEWAPILRRFKALGGEYVTVGSDAHDLEHIGAGVREAYALMKDCGFRYTAVYLGRVPEMEAI